MANYKVHDNPVRDEWMAKIGQLNTLSKGAAFLTDFRKKHTTAENQGNGALAK